MIKKARLFTQKKEIQEMQLQTYFNNVVNWTKTNAPRNGCYIQLLIKYQNQRFKWMCGLPQKLGIAHSVLFSRHLAYALITLIRYNYMFLTQIFSAVTETAILKISRIFYYFYFFLFDFLAISRCLIPFKSLRFFSLHFCQMIWGSLYAEANKSHMQIMKYEERHV